NDNSYSNKWGALYHSITTALVKIYLKINLQVDLMGIINIFAVIEDSLYSVQYENETLHEFEKYFDLWNDPIYLREFFEEHLEDLKSDFWKNITIEEAITRTR